MSSAALAPGLALARANARYWPTVAPLVGRELRRWHARGQAIPDSSLRSLALAKLREEHFNAQVAATLATLAPRAARPATVRALVALEVIYDYLDGLTEPPAQNALANARALFSSFTSALSDSRGPEPPAEGPRPASLTRDGGYLDALGATVRAELARLPAWGSVAPTARGAASRTAEAQARLHSTPLLDSELKEWSRPLGEQSGLGWREFLAGASASVLCCHALIVAGTDPRTTPADAQRVDGFYLRLCALSTLLDAIVDRESDRAHGVASLLLVYPEQSELADALSSLAREAAQLALSLRDGPHHVMIMAGVVAYYTSAPAARSEFARPLTRELRRELSPVILPTLAVMRAWRLAKRMAGPFAALRATT